MTTFIRLTSKPNIDGEITVTSHWHDLSGIERLDLLQDWLGVLTELYNAEYFAQNGGDYKPHAVCLSAIKYQARK